MIYWDCFLLFPVSRLLTWSVSQIQTARLASRASLTPSNLPVPTKQSRWLARTWLIQRAAHRRWLQRIAGRPSLSGHGTLLCLCPAKGVLVWLSCLALDSVVTLTLCLFCAGFYRSYRLPRLWPNTRLLCAMLVALPHQKQQILLPRDTLCSLPRKLQTALLTWLKLSRYKCYSTGLSSSFVILGGFLFCFFPSLS